MPVPSVSSPFRFLKALLPPLALALAGAIGATAAPPTASAQNLLGTPTLPARVESDLVNAELMVHAPQGAAPGQTVWMGLQLAHAPEWHTYWKNPGDSGLPTELQWTLPPGVTAGDVAWPTPRKFPLDTLANYGFDGTVLLPVPLTISPEFQGSHIDVQLYAAWLVCRKECIPEEGRFGLRLPVDGSTALNAQAFEAAFAAAPAAQAPGASAVQPEEGFINVVLDGLPERLRGQTLEFFPEAGGIIEPGAAWTQQWEGARWSAKVPLSPHRGDSPATMALVVAQADPPGEGPGLPGVRLDVPVQGAWPAAAPLPAAVPDALTAALEANAARAAAAPATGGGVPLSLWAALFGALIGGALLNLMPCVFPVLAIKVLSFSQTGNGTAARSAHRVHGLAYTAGVVLSFLALGAVLLALRSAGEQLGWGFQLQSPAVVAALAVLFTLIGLNLAGLFEIGNLLPSRLATLQARNPTTDAFLTGVLASAIASPCTAPFMGASLGLAIGLPPVQALAVFGMLGLGMALPYLAASWVPAVARLSPSSSATAATSPGVARFAQRHRPRSLGAHTCGAVEAVRGIGCAGLRAAIGTSGPPPPAAAAPCTGPAARCETASATR
ncbi:MAG: protein-disulfide reductase DsbD domain-containing protein [Hydrogenophaga sp.]